MVLWLYVLNISELGRKGHGHRITGFDVPDTSKKTLERGAFKPSKLTWVNSVFHGQFEWRYRPLDLQEYVNKTIELRNKNLRTVKKYVRDLEKHFERVKHVKIPRQSVLRFLQSNF